MWTARTSERRAFTLVELVVVLAVVALAAGIVMARLTDPGTLPLAVAARRLADAITLGRERAILGGRPARLVLDLERGRWAVGSPGREPRALAPDEPLAGPVTLSPELKLAAVLVGGAPAAAAGDVALDLDAAGDALPARIDLVDAHGRRASVMVPPAGARARVVVGGAS